MAAVPSAAEAQRRIHRPARVVVVGAYAYPPYWQFYDPWYQRGFWGPYGYPGYRYGAYDPAASLRIDVEPREAQVFVDGYYAGLVDEFDGIFQRLRVEPGGRTITLFLEGYRTEEQHLYLRPNTDQRIRLTMRPLAPGEQSVPPVPAAGGEEADAETFSDAPRALPPGASPRDAPDTRPRQAPDRFGTLSLRVQPASAEVFIDGERWEGAADGGVFTIALPEGRHRVEVRRAGMPTYAEDVLIRDGRTLRLNVG